MVNRFSLLSGLLAILVVGLFACTSENGDNPPSYSGSYSGLVQVNTEYGDFKIKLYEETPRHTENFMKLVGEGFYDSLSFHRIIANTLIQGGDPFSNLPEKRDSLGQGGPGYEIKQEFHPDRLHHYGAVAAARSPDMINKYRNSAGSQFYVVMGQKWTSDDLDEIQSRIREDEKNFLYLKIMNRDGNEWLSEPNQDRLYKENPDSFQIVLDSLDAIYERELTQLEPFTFTKEQRLKYISEGGSPLLDLKYTVFGEVVEGMEVVEKISRQPVSDRLLGRPSKEVKMSMKLLE